MYKTVNELNKIKLLIFNEINIIVIQLHIKINKTKTIIEAKEIKLAFFLFIPIKYNIYFWYEINKKNKDFLIVPVFYLLLI